MSSEIVVYQTAKMKQPFNEWHASLDKRMRATVDGRLERVRLGLLGDCKSVANGVLELRIHVGGGLRIYFSLQGEKLVLLLCGGDKSNQAKDIKLAEKFLADYKERTNESENKKGEK